MMASEREIWSAIVPRHHQTHENMADRFASEAGVGRVTWFNRNISGPAQFHVASSRHTHEVRRFEESDGRHRYIVFQLRHYESDNDKMVRMNMVALLGHYMGGSEGGPAWIAKEMQRAKAEGCRPSEAEQRYGGMLREIEAESNH